MEIKAQGSHRAVYLWGSAPQTTRDPLARVGVRGASGETWASPVPLESRVRKLFTMAIHMATFTVYLLIRHTPEPLLLIGSCLVQRKVL